ncbi:MAG: SHOCT domain-containing protein [Bacteroidales bacterium]|nr:SHOCT domain-containing protein [Bacteroidales bacterium]
MKKLIVFLCVNVIVMGLFAQTVTYQDLVNQKSAKELTGRTGGDDISVYVASNGVTYTKGSTITYGYPTNGKYYVYFKDVTGSVLGSLADDESSNASTSAANREVYERVENRAGGVATIKRIQCVPVDPYNRKTSGCKIYLVLNRGGLACTNFEEALATQEIVTKVDPSDAASEAALQELKKWKEKLDLQIITQEEYDAKKAELMKVIK